MAGIQLLIRTSFIGWLILGAAPAAFAAHGGGGSGNAADYILPIGGGLVHPSRIAAMDVDPAGLNNGFGYMFNSGVGVFLNGATANSSSGGGSSGWNYRGGLAFGQNKLGAGVSFVGNSSSSSGTSNSSQVYWGLGGEVFSDFSLGVAGSNQVSTISAMLNSSGSHRFGFMIVNPFVNPTTSQLYGVGYAYEGGSATLALGTLYSSFTQSGTFYGGFGIHASSFQVICNYAQTYSSASGNSSSNSGLATFGVGFEVANSLDLAVTYSTALLSVLLGYNF